VTFYFKQTDPHASDCSVLTLY